MATVSPPKPWERAGAGGANSALASSGIATGNAVTNPASTTTSSATAGAPVIPERPSSLTSAVNRNASAYSPYGANRLGGMAAPYGGIGLTNGFTQSTQATFQIIESIVGAFGGFSQMLESTYMATHSSFFAMVSVAEQFGNLRNTLGSILGIFTLMRWLRTLFAKITGRPPPADATALTPSAFASFEGRKFHPDGSPAQSPRPSKKPFLFFLAAAFGLPYLMGKLIKALAASQEEEQRRLAALGQMQIGPDGQPIQAQIDPSKLDFCRVLYDFTPEAGAAVQGIDLDVKKGDLVAVLSKSDPMGNPSEWWRCRARDGRMGYLPGVYLEVARRPGGPIPEIKSASQSGSRTSSMTSQTKAPIISGKAGELSVESFQKSQFYS
ncbi:related to peroxisomal membrane protein pex13 [Rhynchosporium graminicola]|uniref:Peroxisomal membrane protein PEX13 n=1 Tax=Rhynchosporium graminicola TaxID=2792576 RepID=A0A1E1KBL1_9HELO|nr:related to peroxisomal membrane protein pex13 [Rhynchosporium commune]